MIVNVPLENGLLPDKYGKYATEEYRLDGHPCVSFPIEISDVPDGTQSFALVLLDWDSIPVCGFAWIHWIACDIDPATTSIPENASRSGALAMVQGLNSEWSPFIGGSKDQPIAHGYVGPLPPDKTHVYTLTAYALDTKLGLSDGYLLNEMRKAMQGHVLAEAVTELPSRA